MVKVKGFKGGGCRHCNREFKVGQTLWLQVDEEGNMFPTHAGCPDVQRRIDVTSLLPETETSASNLRNAEARKKLEEDSK